MKKNIVIVGHGPHNHKLESLFGRMDFSQAIEFMDVRCVVAQSIPRRASTDFQKEFLKGVCCAALPHREPLYGLLLVDDDGGLFRLGYTAAQLEIPALDVFQSTSLQDVKNWVRGLATSHTLLTPKDAAKVVIFTTEDAAKTLNTTKNLALAMKVFITTQLDEKYKQFLKKHPQALRYSYAVAQVPEEFVELRARTTEEVWPEVVDETALQSLLAAKASKSAYIDWALAYSFNTYVSYDRSSKSDFDALRASFVTSRPYLERALADIGSETVVWGWAALFLNEHRMVLSVKSMVAPTNDPNNAPHPKTALELFGDQSFQISIHAAILKLKRSSFDEHSFESFEKYVHLIQHLDKNCSRTCLVVREKLAVNHDVLLLIRALWGIISGKEIDRDTGDRRHLPVRLDEPVEPNRQ